MDYATALYVAVSVSFCLPNDVAFPFVCLMLCRLVLCSDLCLCIAMFAMCVLYVILGQSVTSNIIGCVFMAVVYL